MNITKISCQPMAKSITFGENSNDGKIDSKRLADTAIAGLAGVVGYGATRGAGKMFGAQKVRAAFIAILDKCKPMFNKVTKFFSKEAKDGEIQTGFGKFVSDVKESLAKNFNGNAAKERIAQGISAFVGGAAAVEANSILNE